MARRWMSPLTTILACSLAAVACDDKITYTLDSGGVDADGDGWAEGDDCDDAEPTAYPGAAEYCDELDNDCDAIVDESPEDMLVWYLDNDNDGYGDATISETACAAPSGYVSDNTDCDDANFRSWPGNEENCDNRDNDCDRIIDEETADGGWYALDDDGDGFGAEGTLNWTCVGVPNELDCDDADPTEPQSVDAAGKADWTTIQQGIDAAYSCVAVAPGVYTEAIDFHGRDIAVRSISGPNETIIDASGWDAPVVTFESGEGQGAILSGFTLTGGTGDVEESQASGGTECASINYCVDYYFNHCGGGVFVSGASPTLEDLIIQGNVLPVVSSAIINDWITYYYFSYGGGLCLQSTNVTLRNLWLGENFADQGGAIYLDADSTLDLSQSEITANTAVEGGGVMIDGGALWLTNVLSTWNWADQDGGGVMSLDGALGVTNATFGADDAPTGGGIYLSGNSQSTVQNTIVYGAGSGAGIQVDATSVLVGLYNNVYGNAGGEYSGVTDPTGSLGNISADPVFSDVTDDGDYTNDDWRIRPSSPSVDAGDPDAAYQDADGSTNDQGAHGGPGGDW